MNQGPVSSTPLLSAAPVLLGIAFVVVSCAIQRHFFPRVRESSPKRVDRTFEMEVLTSVHSADLNMPAIVDAVLHGCLKLTTATQACLIYSPQDSATIVYTLHCTQDAPINISAEVKVVKNRGLVGAVLQSSAARVVNSLSSSMLSDVERKLGMEGAAVVCVPIVRSAMTVGVLICSGHSFAPSALSLLTCLTENFVICTRKLTECTASMRQRMLSEGILLIAQARSTEESFEQVLKQMINAVYKVVDAEFVSLFVCDHYTRELTLVASKDGFNGFTIGFDEGISGYVATTALSVRIDDCYSDPRFDKKMDHVAQHRTKSMICVPVLGFGKSRDKTIAVIQAMNKESNELFSADDERVLTRLAEEVSKTLRKRIVDLNAVSAVKVSEDSLLDGLYNEFGSTISTRFKIESDLSVLAVPRALSRNGFYFDMNKPLLSPATPSRSKSYLDDTFKVNTWNLDPFLESEDDLIRLLMVMLYDLNVISILNIDKKQLIRFLEAVRSNYRDMRFHNFRHAFGVTHTSFMILKLGAAEYLTPLEQLALLLSAVCHDLDHPGNNNAFEIASNSRLALLYSYDTVLERHHTHLAQTLINDPDNSLLSELSPADMTEFRQIVTHAILSTEMAKHQDQMNQLMRCAVSSPPFDATSKPSRYMLISFIMHCADIGAQTQDLSIAQKWSERVIDEFSDQARREEELGIPQTAFMVGLESELMSNQLQAGFTSGFVLPLWQEFSACLPKLQCAAEQCASNAQYYKSIVLRLQPPVDEETKESK